MDTKLAAAVYLRAGLALLPVGAPGAQGRALKAPNFDVLPKDGTTGRATWAPLQVPATRAGMTQVLAWLSSDPQTGLGIIAGGVSGNLVVLDCDSAPFCSWLEHDLLESFLKRTWTVRTGSGKLHVYLRGDAPRRSSILLAADGTKLADIRGDGSPDLGTGPSYVVAPPSRHPSGARYATLCGAPTAIAHVDGDATRLLERLVARYALAAPPAPLVVSPPHVGVIRPAPSPPDDGGDDGGRLAHSVLPPLAGEAKAALKARLQAAFPPGDKKRGYILATISHGRGGAPGNWAKCPSESEVDAGVLTALRREGFTARECEQVFATYGIGAACYRNATRGGSFGWDYFKRTVRHADFALRRELTATLAEAGENFTILSIRRYDYDPPRYEFTLRNKATKQDDVAILAWDEWQTERGFSTNVGRQCPRLLPILKRAFSGAGYPRFVDACMQAATLEAVPVEARQHGYLRATVKESLSRVQPWPGGGVPGAGREFTLGFRDDARQEVFVRGARLIAAVSGRMQRVPFKAEDIWFVMRALGGRERRVTYGGGSTETLWVLPVTAIEGA